nr:immunoglobulin heavy chain junction region [Macaca mulatta]MOV38251.1 immunoglobulin heavy chain junction region [Macaca mulatta]MOV38816.1 immunoglobulin heavy chain junction region [Macaca mulatta]MOV40354.1 immunoglobulin heavy chain junction region [Macaca mulatta]MOV40548.1 immunoglobulin heavy chain junction region [Macaca mulatta]
CARGITIFGLVSPYFDYW